jgi:hypothetical protein
MTERGVEREGVGASGLPGPGETPVWRRLAEGLLLAYLLTLPGGMLVPGWVRAPLLYGVIVAGVLDAGLGSRGARVRGLLSAGLFFGVHALTIVTSEHRDLSLGLSVFTPVVALVFVVAQRVLVSRGAIDRLFGCLGLIAAVVSVDGFCQAVFRWSPLLMGGVTARDRISASLPHPNDLVVVPMLLPFAWEWLRARGRRWVIAGICVLGPAVLVSLLASKSRNAWLTMGGVAGVWSLLVLGWRWSLGIAVAGAGAVGGLLALDLFGVRERAGDFLRLERDGRVGLWLVAWAMFRESPWLGKGVFTFGEYYRPSWYAFRVGFPAGYIPEARIIPWAHNLVLEMLSERGVAGLASFVYLIGSAAASARRRLREPRVAAVLSALAGFLGASLVDLTLMKDWVALMLFLLLAMLWSLSGEARQGIAKGDAAPAGAGAAAGGNRVG